MAGPITTEDDLAIASSHISTFEYRRDESGRVTDEIATNVLGETVWTFHFTTATSGNYMDRHGIPAPTVGSGAAYVEFVWTETGLPSELRYRDAANKPQPDARGAYRERREFDSQDQIVRTAQLDQNGKPTTNRLSPPIIQSSHDEQGNVQDVAFTGRGIDPPRAQRPKADDEQRNDDSDRDDEGAADEAVLERRIGAELMGDEETSRAECQARPRHEAGSDLFGLHRRGTQ